MAGLGIGTTRALSLVVSEDLVDRDPLYNGKVIKEKCAVVLRVSPSFIRFGSFQICIEGEPGDVAPSYGLESSMIPKLFDFVHKNHFSDLSDPFSVFKEIVKRTAEMVAQWQTVGFVHGVLNTDNMSILGLTIDYGPFQF